jgi:rhamnulokinase
MPINTIFQLLAMAIKDSAALHTASTLLMMPDLFNYWLTGEVGCEFTGATTTQCYDPTAGAWALDLVERLGIPTSIFPRIIPPATVLGPLQRDIAEDIGGPGMAVIAPACHDTAAAVAAVPARGDRFAYICSGTWSLVGTEVPAPLITADVLAHNFTSEGGAFGRSRFLKNVMGLWLLQECRRAWAEDGAAVSFDTLVAEAETAPSTGVFVNPDDERFLRPTDMPSRIRQACRESGQRVPDTRAGVVRCILESLALRYRWVLDRLDAILGRRTEVIHIVGGGARNALLCRLTADVTGRFVEAGPVEATAMGNVLIQACALGHATPHDVREIARRSTSLAVYEPSGHARWADAYHRFLQLCA